jgi:hypothetical protein
MVPLIETLQLRIELTVVESFIYMFCETLQKHGILVDIIIQKQTRNQV